MKWLSEKSGNNLNFRQPFSYGVIKGGSCFPKRKMLNLVTVKWCGYFLEWNLCSIFLKPSLSLIGGSSSCSPNFQLISAVISANKSAPCQVIEIVSIKVSIPLISPKVRQVLRMIESHPLLDWIMPSDFKAFGSAFAISERGISRNAYSTKKNNKALIELYCSPKFLEICIQKEQILIKLSLG